MATTAQDPRSEKLFFWTEPAVGRKGKPRSGEVRAKSESHARFLLRQQGVRVHKLTQVRNFGPQNVKLPIVAAFVRQLSVMIQSGVPLAQSLGLIASNLQGNKYKNLRNVVRAIRADVESGLRLSEAMRKHPQCFDAIFCNTLMAGEDSGELDSVMMRLASHMEKVLRTRQRIRKAMTYPAIVVVVAIAVSVGLLAFVIPTFRTVYASFKTELPGLTKILLQLSDLITQYGIYMGAGLVAALFALRYSYGHFMPFRHRSDQVLLKLPVVGELMRIAIYARWTRTFSTLSAAGVPIVGALESVAQVAGNKRYEDATLQIRQDVATGSSVSSSMEKTGLFPAEATQMLKIGEESGRMDQMLDRIASQYETRLDDLVDNLSTIMEPAIMSLIGVIVGVLIIGMYLPIFNIGGVF